MRRLSPGLPCLTSGASSVFKLPFHHFAGGVAGEGSGADLPEGGHFVGGEHLVAPLGQVVGVHSGTCGGHHNGFDLLAHLEVVHTEYR